MKLVNRNINVPLSVPLSGTATADGDPATSKALYGGRLSKDFRFTMYYPDNAPAGGANLDIIALGYKPWSGRIEVPVQAGTSNESHEPAIELEPSVGPFDIVPIAHESIEPFDRDNPNPPFDRVHTTLPANQIIKRGPKWMCGDFGGMTLKAAPPWVPGCNTTPPEMVMTFLLPFYIGKSDDSMTHPYSQQAGKPLPWVDIILMEAAERGYWTIHLSKADAENAGLSDEQLLDFIAYIISRGFDVSMWLFGNGMPRDSHWNTIRYFVEPFLNAIISRGLAPHFIPIMGGECNEWNGGGPNFDSIIRGLAAITKPAGMHLYLHLTTNYPALPPPGMDETVWLQQFSDLDGWFHLAWQAQDNAPSYLISSRLWDARIRWAQALPNSVVCAFELRSNSQLYGKYTETEGCRIGWECICAPPGPQAPNALPTGGSMSGFRYPNGDPPLQS